MNILSIGNSFSQDATAYLHQIADGAGIKLNAENLYIGGCSLEKHANNYKSEAADYLHEINGSSTDNYVTIQEMLKENKWDFITFQQVSQCAPDFSTYNPYLSELSEAAKQYCPDTPQVIHQTWAYEDGSERLCNELGYKTSEEMFCDIESAYKKAAEQVDAQIIPSGLAFILATRQGYAPIHRDTFHARIPQGRYLLGAVWFEFFCGVNASQSSFLPEGMTSDEKKFMDRIAHEAIAGKNKQVYKWG